MSWIPDGFGQATINMDYISGPSNPLACVFGYDHGGGFNPDGHAVVIGNAWRDRIMSLAQISNNLLFKSVTVAEDTAHLAGEAAYNTTGPNIQSTQPPQVAVLLSKVTGLGGRKNRGRLYLPGTSVDSTIEGGFLTGAASLSIATGFDNFRSDLAAADLAMVVLHSTALLGAPAPVVSLVVQTVLATQRRRIR